MYNQAPEGSAEKIALGKSLERVNHQFAVWKQNIVQQNNLQQAQAQMQAQHLSQQSLMNQNKAQHFQNKAQFNPCPLFSKKLNLTPQQQNLIKLKTGQNQAPKSNQWNFLGDQSKIINNKIETLFKEETGDQADGAVKDVLLNMADNFIDQVMVFATQLCLHRMRESKNVLDVTDIQLALERNWNVRIPGFTDHLKIPKKFPQNQNYNNRSAALKKTIRESFSHVQAQKILKIQEDLKKCAEINNENKDLEKIELPIEDEKKIDDQIVELNSPSTLSPSHNKSSENFENGEDRPIKKQKL
ncbi:Transcription initiation factor TFIID subunit 12 [Clydaea vesicula]|uniref:Transcription initiation factor TFIID subunit 12 n=1 Tax=Clydaea vesicula TaxID=447962 RepID=A0AAD5U788_9FUNG|nr:Transcription initiation factor TFIID subunit 12 [Clydaea vesicula]